MVRVTLSTGQELTKEPPLPEPPPSSDEVWVNDICSHVTSISNNNDETNTTYKPKVAKIVFDDAEQYHTVLDHINDLTKDLPIHHSIENDIDLSSINDSEYDSPYRTHGIDNDESHDVLQSTIKHLAGSNDWTPNLNTIIEETSYDIDQFNDNVYLTPSSTTSGKRRRRQQSILRQQQDLHESKIAQAINRNGIYRVNIHNAQNDGGANRSVTSSKDLLLHFEEIANYGINGVKEGEAAIVCTGRGFLPWRANSGEIILIRCLYCAEASGTILSPSDVNSQYADRYGGWTMTTDHDSKTGIFKLLSRDGINHLEFTSYSENNLWFHYLDQVTEKEYNRLGNTAKAIVKTLSTGASYELWHNRLGHPGERIMDEVHKHVSGVPKFKRNKFYSCSSCMSAKFRKNILDNKRNW